MGDTDRDGASVSTGGASWSWEENKRFELALAAVDEREPDRWAAIASMVGKEKSAEDARRHFEALLEDLCTIESGVLDYEYIQLFENMGEAICWGVRDQEWFAQLRLSS